MCKKVKTSHAVRNKTNKELDVTLSDTLKKCMVILLVS
jgi:hypothetical protein